VTVAAPAPEAARTEPRRSPYQGLLPYTEADADWFFGRETWSEIVVDNMLAHRLTVLYGASGVGKSSLINAGVVKQLREDARRNVDEKSVPQLAVVTFSSWSTTDVVGALKEAIRDAVERVAPELVRNPPAGSLVDVLAEWSERIHGPLLVILDQFEEYFLYHPRDAGPGSFYDELSAALRRRDTPATFLLSIREDALAQLDRFEGRVAGLLDNLLRIDHLDSNAAREAIERPIELWNKVEAAPGQHVQIEHALVDEVLKQVETGKVLVGAAGAGVAASDDSARPRIEAPYLQLVLSRLWGEEQSAGSRVLRLDTLAKLGGAQRIVRTHLDATMSTFPKRQQDIAAQAFRYLVTPSGTKIAHGPTDLAELTEVPKERLEPVLSRLAAREVFILRPAGDDKYEIYHDALAGPILDWRARWEEQKRRRRWRLRAAFAGAALIALAALAVAAVSFVDARHQRDLARSRELAAVTASAAQAQLGSDPHESLRLAVQAADAASIDIAEAVLRVALAEDRLLAVLPPTGFEPPRGPVETASFSPDGRLVVTAGDAGAVRIWKFRTIGDSIALGTESKAPARSAGFDRDGTHVVAAGTDGTARIWNVRTRRSVILGNKSIDPVSSAAFSSDGTLVVTTKGWTARVWRSPGGPSIASLIGFAPGWQTSSFSPDGARVVLAGDRGASLWTFRGGPLRELQQDSSPAEASVRPARRLLDSGVHSAVFNPDGTRVVTASDDGRARIFDVRTGNLLRVLGHGAPIYSAAFNPKGTLVVTAGRDGAARVFRAGNGLSLSALRGHTAPIRRAAFSPDGKLIVTASDDGTARVFDVVAEQSLAVLRGHAGRLRTVAFSPDGKLIVTGGDDGTARVWRSPLGRPVNTRPVGAALIGKTVSPDGKLVATAGQNGKVRIANARTGELIAAMGGGETLRGIAFSPDSELVVTASKEGTALVWDIGSRELVFHTPGAGGPPLRNVSFSPDGTLVVTAGDDGRARVWDYRNSSAVPTDLTGHGGRVYSAVFSPDSKLVVTASHDGTARVWSLRTGQSVALLRGHVGPVLGAAFSPDGTLVVTSGGDKTARVFDALTGQSLAILLGASGRVIGALFAPDGKRIVTTSADGEVRTYLCDVCGSLEELRARAREQLAHG
jgi:WD40 repeat protein